MDLLQFGVTNTQKNIRLVMAIWLRGAFTNIFPELFFVFSENSRARKIDRIHTKQASITSVWNFFWESTGIRINFLLSYELI